MSLATPTTITPYRAGRFSFLIKPALIVSLAFVANVIFASGDTIVQAGSISGLFALAWLAAIVASNRAIRASRPAMLAVAGSAVAGLSLTIEPGMLAPSLYLFFIGLAVALPRYIGFGSALVWLGRVLLLGAVNSVAVLSDAWRLNRLLRGPRRMRWLAALGFVMLPLAGSAVFIALFAAANPLLARILDWLADWRADETISGSMLTGLAFTLASIVFLWGSFRPLRLHARRGAAAKTGPLLRLGVVNPLSVTASLILFNTIFALQNLSDIVFLWSGAPLPGEVKLADYVHSGSTIPLMGTTLLAAAFVLAFLRTGSVLAQNRMVRLLVYGWIGQNVLLTRSAMLRTVNYVASFSLTELRLAVLIWMGLIVIGLVLICWRLATQRTGVWLINANALCVVVILLICSFVNFDGIIARWNIAHRQTSFYGALDIEYLHRLGPGALTPIMASVEAAGDPPIHDMLLQLGSDLRTRIEQDQADWRRWTIANAFRLAALAH